MSTNVDLILPYMQERKGKSKHVTVDKIFYDGIPVERSHDFLRESSSFNQTWPV